MVASGLGAVEAAAFLEKPAKQFARQADSALTIAS
jgi:hypothetical protein